MEHRGEFPKFLCLKNDSNSPKYDKINLSIYRIVISVVRNRVKHSKVRKKNCKTSRQEGNIYAVHSVIRNSEKRVNMALPY